MGSVERSKKKVQPWKRAILHFLLCFVMGFFTGFAPMGKSSIFTNHAISSDKPDSPLSAESLDGSSTSTTNRSLIVETPPMADAEGSNSKEFQNQENVEKQEEEEEADLVPKGLVIIVTPTNTRDKLQGVLLRKMANTLSLVSPPLLWIVVEKHSESDEISRILRKTSVMYRHLVFKENFTDAEAELDHQRNVALRHIEHHRLSGIVHFGALSNIYDLDFFDELRGIEVFGTWPVAYLAASKKTVLIEGPVCQSSQVIGWHLRKMKNQTEPRRPLIRISSFAFNSSILWDPERWGRTSSVQDTSQNSMRFVKQVVLEDEGKLKGLPFQDCARILLWHLQLPSSTLRKPFP